MDWLFGWLCDALHDVGYLMGVVVHTIVNGLVVQHPQFANVLT